MPKTEQHIYELLWTDAERALAMWEKHFAAKVRAKTLTKPAAQAQLLAFMLRITLQQFHLVDLEAAALQDFFKKSKAGNHLAMLQAWRMFAYISTGDMAAANQLRQSFDKNFSVETAPEAHLHYYLFSCFYSDKNGYYEDFIRLANETETLLKKTAVPESWRHALSALGKLFISRTYSHYGRFDEARALLDEVRATAEAQQLSTFIHQQIFINEGVYCEASGQREQAAAALKAIVALLENQPHYQLALFNTYANIIHLYNQRNSKLSVESAAFIARKQEQKAYLDAAEPLLENYAATATAGFFYYAKAWYHFELGQSSESLRCIARSVRIFYKLRHNRFLTGAYTLAYTLYSREAARHRNYLAGFKAARSSERMRLMSDAYYKQLLQERIESIELKFKIREKELNEKLLRQKIDAMNKEIQLANLNLHEKVMVLDELKTYVHSLKRKELETRQLINTIGKKIDSVKITEQDKAMLQQKMDEGNKQFTNLLSEKYPSLSTLEIRMCTLFQTGVSNKELAKLYGQSEKAYEQHRYRIKKKMNLKAGENLVKHLVKLSEGSN